MSDPNQDPDENEVLKELRAQNKKLQKDLADQGTQIRAQVQREVQAQKLFEQVGYPKLAAAFLKEATDSEVTADTVNEFLDGYGLEPRKAPPAGTSTNLQEVTSFADRIAAQAQGTPADLESELDEAAKSMNPKEFLDKTAEIFQKHGVQATRAQTRY